jgi:hypothetical protein
MDNYIKENEYNSRVVTKIRTVQPYIHLHGDVDQETNYFRYGSGDCVVRFYNKVREICEQQEKAFFFPKWLDNNLIDKKTFDIYEFTYKLNNNYRIDFIYSNILFSELSDTIKYEASKIYRDYKIETDDKYKKLNKILKVNKLKCIHEIVNVEYQLRHGFLKSIQTIKDKTGSYIDYTNMFDLLEHTQDLYTYITDNVFRVVDRNHNTKRKRDRNTDPDWILIQNSKINNIFDYELDDEKLNFYRKYNSMMSEINTTKKILKSMSHLYYINNDYTIEDADNINIDDLVLNVYKPFALNESLFNINDYLKKQIKYYGKKK